MAESRITKFIERHHVLTLATSDEAGAPYCCNLFYSFDKEGVSFIFASGDDTHHVEQMQSRAEVAASIVLESRVVGKLQGLQIVGRVVRGGERERDLYIKSFPYAAVLPLKLWRLDVEWLKMTDNRLGFGKKIIWRRE